MIELDPVPDLVGELAALDRPGQIRIGFALEPRDQLAAAARTKLEAKDLHAVVANPLETMNADSIEGCLVTRDGIRHPPRSPAAKRDFARWLVSEALRLPNH